MMISGPGALRLAKLVTTTLSHIFSIESLLAACCEETNGRANIRKREIITLNHEDDWGKTRRKTAEIEWSSQR